MERRSDGEKGITVSGPKNKEFDDLPKYLPWMTDYARHLVSDEYAKDVVHLALLDAHTPTKTRPPAEDEKRVKAWLWTLLRFRAMGVWRAKHKRCLETNVDDDVNALSIAAPADWETTIENRQWLQRALDELSEEQRKLVIDCDIEEVSLAQLSRTSGISEDTLRTRLRRAHDQLRATLMGLHRGRLRTMFPFFFLQRREPTEARIREPWTLRIRRGFWQIARQPMQWGTSVIAVACVLSLAPGSPCAKDEPLPVAIAPEPVQVDKVVIAADSATVLPGTGQLEVTESSPATTTPSKPVMKTSMVSPKKNAATPNEASAVDDMLIVQAKAALNRRDAKRALELLAEHERRFPNSPNAEFREQLRRAAVRMSK